VRGEEWRGEARRGEERRGEERRGLLGARKWKSFLLGFFPRKKACSGSKHASVLIGRLNRRSETNVCVATPLIYGEVFTTR